MLSPIDAYLGRLSNRLGRKLSKGEAAEHVLEIGAHLREGCEHLAQLGQSKLEAEVEALRRLGSDRLVAENLLREHSGVLSLSVWRLAWLPALLLLSADFLPRLLIGRLRPELFNLWIFAPWIGAILFVIACWRSRRLIVVPLVAATFLASVGAVVLFTFGPSGVTESSALERHQEIAHFDQAIRRLKDLVDQVRLISPNAPLPPAFTMKGGYWAPSESLVVNLRSSSLNPIAVETGRTRTIDLKPVASEAVAKRLWREHGAAFSARLNCELNEQRSLRYHWQTMLHGWSQVRICSIQVLSSYGPVVVMITLLNVLALTARKWRDEIVQRTWRPERLV